MIPSLLLLGLVLGGFARHRESASLAVAVGGAAALIWGIGVGASDREVSTFLVGTLTALPNLLFGAATAASLVQAWHWYMRIESASPG